MEIEIQSVEFSALPCKTRLPFRFGVTTLTEAPLLTARVSIRVDGVEVEGFAADLAIAKWFDKDPSKTTADNVRALADSASRAGRAFSGRSGTPFGIWLGAHQACVYAGAASGVKLVDGFGVALVERAMIDAACRHAGLSFFEALREDLFRFDPGVLLRETKGLTSPQLVSSELPERVLLRHTVGGLDPLRTNEVPEDLREQDEHPVALEEDIARYGLRAFKLKAGGEPEADAARLTAIARIVAEAGVEDPTYTLDANEQYSDLTRLGLLLDRLESDPDGQLLMAGLQYVEQPISRADTFDPRTGDAVRGVGKTVPLIIDEADDDVDAFQRALALGYRGVSVKNCKGVFRALTNRALCEVENGTAFQTSEDLTNLPVLALQQDLATLAVLGLTHTERNGHHFFAGLDVVPAAEAESALAAHPDLYERKGDRIVLKICEGEISLACAKSRGYGFESQIDWKSRAPLESLDSEPDGR